MKKTFTLLLLLSFLLSVPGTFADEGMWTVDNPPLAQWKERYKFEPSKEWLENVRLASPKVGGASAGFLNPKGPVAAKPHLAGGFIAEPSNKGTASTPKRPPTN